MEKVRPEDVGMSSARLEAIRATVQGYVDEGKVAGLSTLIARQGRVVHFECYGKLDLEANKPVQSDSIFRIYSITKPVTAVAVLQLLEEGQLSLDDPVSKYIPEFKSLTVYQDTPIGEAKLLKLEQEITIWHLLTHTSGLSISGYGSTPVYEMYGDAKIVSDILTLQVSLPELIDKLASLPLANQPGKEWRYSFAYDVLGYLLQVISGQPFDQVLKERILDPLDMQDTSFFVPDEKRHLLGPMYSKPGENGISVEDGIETSPFLNPNVTPSGGVGLVSTMGDYFRFLLMLANGGKIDNVRLLQRDTLKQMTTNQLTGEQFPVRFEWGPWKGMGYGLGVGVQVDVTPRDGYPLGAFGWVGLSGTMAWVYPQEDIIILAMAQSFWYMAASSALVELVREAIVD